MSKPYVFDWHNIPPEIRLGSHPDEELTLYRGFAPHQFDPERGMLSSALRYGQYNLVDEVIQAVDTKQIRTLIQHISTHADNLDGQTTPFVSAAHERAVAERFAQRPGEMIATLHLCADQLVVVPMMPFEVLVIGSIGLHSVVNIQEPTLAK